MICTWLMLATLSTNIFVFLLYIPMKIVFLNTHILRVYTDTLTFCAYVYVINTS